MVIASSSVNSVSAVPWISSVGTRIAFTSDDGPRESNHARSSADSLPVLAPETNAEVMCGSSVPVCTPAGETMPSRPEVGTPAP